MSEAAFDTHAEIRKLEQAGCPAAQAEAVVDLVNRAPPNIQMVKVLERLTFQIETNMATKADIADLRAETKAGIADLRADTQAGIADLRADTQAGIADLRADTQAGIADLRAHTQAGIADLRTDTKADNAGLRTETKADIADLRTECRTEFANLRTDIADLRADMFRALWIQGGALAALILALAGLMLGFAASLGPGG